MFSSPGAWMSSWARPGSCEKNPRKAHGRNTDFNSSETHAIGFSDEGRVGTGVFQSLDGFLKLRRSSTWRLLFAVTCLWASICNRGAMLDAIISSINFASPLGAG